MSNLKFIFLYLDPGTGSILIQFIIAAIAAIGFYLSTMRKKIKLFFKRRSEKKK
jgi:hypothetical protein